MPQFNEDGPFYITSITGAVEFKQGAGRLLWGEGLPEVVDKEARKASKKKQYNVTLIRKSVTPDQAAQPKPKANKAKSETAKK